MPKESVPRRLVTLKYAAEYAAVHEHTVRRKIAEGKLTGYRFGTKALRVDLNEIDALLRPIPTVGKCLVSDETPGAE